LGSIVQYVQYSKNVAKGFDDDHQPYTTTVGGETTIEYSVNHDFVLRTAASILPGHLAT